MRIPRSGPALLGPILFALAALTACNGGSSTAPAFFTGPSPAPTAPAAVPTLAPAAAATTVPLASGSAPAQTVAIPPAAGLSGSLVLPAATLPAGTTLAVQTTTTAPAGVPTLSSTGRQVRAVGSGIEPLYYQGLAFTQTVTFPAFPAFSIALPSGYDPSKGVFGLAFYDGSSWSYPLGSAGVANGQTINFSGAAGPVTYQANRVYFFALYYSPTPPAPTPSPTPTATPTASPTASPTAVPTASPTPSPGPTATPTPVPTATPTPTPTPTPGPLTVSPSPLSFLGTGSDLTQTVTVSSTNYTGTFTASACTNAQSTNVADVSAVGPNNTFTVTPKAPGTCSIVVSDNAQRQTTLNVSVATSSLTVNGKHH